ncbi:MAG: tetratricopeptide repeat protein [Melioribacteraceae bacterium]|nr:tetratricopeptide repeat protein [Melioribacteraceae bacterium]MCF8265654.1 tetratricopeptide repeat protein [Melioribacteraceae bacterium]MCF8411969.1 tetratricopeptide repeat protein [Melioribacteraceae bacterium]MCF8432654.1 tetratricopeptide repeat protein [Melioribacteraceae bacterium]
MKRLLAFAIIVSMALGITAFQCGSTEMTSAKLYIQQKKFDKAKESLEKEVEKNPKNDEAFYLLGTVEAELGNYNNILENFDKALEISTKNKEKIEMAKLSYWGKNYNMGVSNFSRGTNVNDKDSAATYFNKSVEAFKTAIAFQPDSMQSYQNIVYSYLNLGKTEEAIPYLEQIIEKTGSEDSYIRLGRIYFNQGEEARAAGETEKSVEYYNKTINLLEKGREANPSSIDILNVLSFSYLRLDKMDVALESFKSAVDQDPENVEYRYIYGTLLLQNKDFEKASMQFEKGLSIDPVHESSMRQLVAAYTNWGIEIKDALEKEENFDDKSYLEYIEKALPIAEKLVELKDASSDYWELYAKVLTNLGKTDEAKEAYAKADALK